MRNIAKNCSILLSLGLTSLVSWYWLHKDSEPGDPHPHVAEELATNDESRSLKRDPNEIPVAQMSNVTPGTTVTSPSPEQLIPHQEAMEDQIKAAQEQLDNYHSQLGNQLQMALPTVVIGNQGQDLPTVTFDPERAKLARERAAKRQARMLAQPVSESPSPQSY